MVCSSPCQGESPGSIPGGRSKFIGISLATLREIIMSYRKLEVDGQVFEYSIGRTHTKIRGVGAYNNREVGYVISDREVRVRPSDLAEFIKRNQLKVKSEDKRRKA